MEGERAIGDCCLGTALLVSFTMTSRERSADTRDGSISIAFSLSTSEPLVRFQLLSPRHYLPQTYIDYTGNQVRDTPLLDPA
jgi:hypothetical protein